MIDSDRLDELSTYVVDDDTPDDAKIRIPAGDLRDLVALIPVVRAAMAFDGDDDYGCEERFYRTLDELRAKGAGNG